MQAHPMIQLWLLCGAVYSCIVAFGLNIYDKEYISNSSHLKLAATMIVTTLIGPIGLLIFFVVFIKEFYKEYK